MVCDLTIAADNAIFGQTGPKVHQSFTIRTNQTHNLSFVTSCPCIYKGWEFRCGLRKFYHVAFGEHQISSTIFVCLNIFMLSIRKVEIMILNTGRSEKSARNVVSCKVLYCCRSRENGPYQHCCTSKLLEFSALYLQVLT